MDATDSLILPTYTPSPLVLRLQVEELPAHLPTLEAELKNVLRIEILREGKVVAEIRAREPESLDQAERPEMPDFMARMKQMWGDRVFEDSTPLIRADRDAGY